MTKNDLNVRKKTMMSMFVTTNVRPIFSHSGRQALPRHQFWAQQRFTGFYSKSKQTKIQTNKQTMVYRGSDPLGSGQLTLGWKTVSFSPVLQHEVLIQQVGKDSLLLIVRLMIRKTTTWKTGRNWR